MVLVRASLVGVLAAAVTAAPAAQNEPPQTTFRSGLDLVSVAVVVRDGDGRIVPNLKPRTSKSSTAAKRGRSCNSIAARMRTREWRCSSTAAEAWF
jgi:hypothetical protein